jgi:hypothetical protein
LSQRYTFFNRGAFFSYRKENERWRIFDDNHVTISTLEDRLAISEECYAIAYVRNDSEDEESKTSKEEFSLDSPDEVDKFPKKEVQEPTQLSQELAERALREFVKHYYPLDSLRERFMELIFRAGQCSIKFNMNSHNHSTRVDDIIFLIRCNQRIPFARGLVAIEEMWTSLYQDSRENGLLHNNDVTYLVSEIRDYLWFSQKAKEVQAAGYHKLADLWKQVAQTRLQGKEKNASFKDSFNSKEVPYIAAKLEEARILGCKSHVDYWSLVQNNLERDDFICENRLVISIREESSIREMLTAQDWKKILISIYEAQARKAEYLNNELATLWNQVVLEVKNGNQFKEHKLFLAAWCLSKAEECKPVAIIWKEASNRFKEINELDSNAFDTAVKIVEVAHLANEFLNRAIFWRVKANGERRRCLLQLYETCTNYFEKTVDEISQLISVDQKTIRFYEVKERFRSSVNSFEADIKKALEWLEEINYGDLFVHELLQNNFGLLTENLNEKVLEYEEAIERYSQLARQQAEEYLYRRRDVSTQEALREAQKRCRSYGIMLMECKSQIGFIHEFLKEAKYPEPQQDQSLGTLFVQATEISARVVEHILRYPGGEFDSVVINNISFSSQIPYHRSQIPVNFKYAISHYKTALASEEENDYLRAGLYKEISDLFLDIARLREKILRPSQHCSMSWMGHLRTLQTFLCDTTNELDKKRKIEDETLNKWRKKLLETFIDTAKRKNCQSQTLFFKAIEISKRFVQIKMDESLYSQGIINSEVYPNSGRHDDIKCQLLHAAQLFEEKDFLRSEFEEEKALLHLFLLEEIDMHNDCCSPQWKEKLELLLQLGNSPQVYSQPNLMTTWLEVIKQLKSSTVFKRDSDRGFQNNFRQWGGEYLLRDFLLNALESQIKGHDSATESWNEAIKEIKMANEYKTRQLTLQYSYSNGRTLHQEKKLSKNRATEARERAVAAAKKAVECEKDFSVNEKTDSTPASDLSQENISHVRISNSLGSHESIALNIPVIIALPLDIGSLSELQSEYLRKIGPGSKSWKKAGNLINLTLQLLEKAQNYHSLGNETNESLCVEVATMSLRAANKFALSAENRKISADARLQSHAQEHKKTADELERKAEKEAQEATKRSKRT